MMERSNAFPKNTLAKNKRQKVVKCRLMQIPIVRRAVLLVVQVVTGLYSSHWCEAGGCGLATRSKMMSSWWSREKSRARGWQRWDRKSVSWMRQLRSRTVAWCARA
jgi:hypothetical protein